MKLYKILCKRGLALFLAFTMCLSLMQATALAGSLAAPADEETICGIPAHIHSEACYTPDSGPSCGLEEAAGHVHDGACFEAGRELVCELEETETAEGHAHGDECYAAGSVLICALEEAEGHSHGDVCCANVLACGLEETETVEGHAHGDECYAAGSVLICALEEAEGHSHGDMCYANVLACGLEEHEHVFDCYDVPDEVLALLDMMRELPEAEEVTAGNVMDVMNALCGETVGDGYAYASSSTAPWAALEEIQAACGKYEAVYRAADELLELESGMYDNYGLNNNCTLDGLQSWLHSASSNSTIEVSADFWLNGTLTIPSGKTVTVKSTGGRIFRGTGGGLGCPMFEVQNGATLVLQSIEVQGRDWTDKTPNSTASMIQVNGGTLILENGATLSDGRFHADSNAYGGAVYLSGGSFTMKSGSTITDCYANNGGGAVYVAAGTFIAEGGANIGQCWTNGQGTKVYAASGATFNNYANIDQVHNENGGTSSRFETDGNKGRVYLTVNTQAFNGLPGEPSVVTSKFIWVTKESNSPLWLDSAYAIVPCNGDPAEFIDESILDSEDYIKDTASDSWGVSDPTGVKTLPLLKISKEQWDDILNKLANFSEWKLQVLDEDGEETHLTSTNEQNYEIIPYVIKYQTEEQNEGDNKIGWHIDCAVVPKGRVQVDYILNLPDGVTTDKQFNVPTGEIGMRSVTLDSLAALKYNSQEIKKDGTVVANLGTKSVTLKFTGWNTAADGSGTTYQPGEAATFSESTQLYAQWEVQSPSYQVEFYYMNEDGNGYTKTEPVETRYPTIQEFKKGEVSIKDADKTPSDANKYELDAGNTDEVWTADLSGDSKTVLKVYFKLKTASKSYTVEYYQDGVKVEGDSQPVPVDNVPVTATELLVKSGSVNTSKYSGYELSYINEAGNQTVPATVAVNGTIKVYYTAIEYKITYEYDGGTAPTTENPAKYTVKATITINNEPTKANHTFQGWILQKEDGTYPDASTAQKPVTIPEGSTGDRTYKAVWQENGKYTLAVRMVKETVDGEQIGNSVNIGSFYTGTNYSFTEDEQGTSVNPGENSAIIYPKFVTAGNNKYVYVSGADNGTIGSADETITLVYALDNWHDGKDGTDPDKKEGGDGIPDSQQVLIDYAVAKDTTGTGTVDPEFEVITLEEKTINVTPTGKATAGENSAFAYWTQDSGKIYKADLKEESLSVEGGKSYTYTATFLKDEKGSGENGESGDGTPDEWQVFVKYVAGKGGRVRINATESENVKKAGNTLVYNLGNDTTSGTINRAGATAESSDETRYTFADWKLDTDSAFSEKNPELPAKEMTVNGGKTYTYTASWKENGKYTLTVKMVKETVNGEQIGASVTDNFYPDKEYTFTKGENADEVTGNNGDYTYPAKVTVAGNNYIYDSGADSGTIGSADKTVTLVYALDNWHDGKDGTDSDKKEGGDGIPDSQQVLVEYKANSNGRVEPDFEVFTLEDGVKLSGMAAANSGFHFTSWTNNNGAALTGELTKPALTCTLTDAQGGKTYTFTANFDRNNSGSNGNNNGNSGNSGSSGGSSSSGGSTGGTTTIPNNPTPLDPGITIADQDVPLAGAVGLNDTDHFAYVIGYEDDTVRPLNNISRAEAATIFFRLMTDDFRQANWATENSFTDVKAGDWYNNAISTCANAGALKGRGDGSVFAPNANITRAEFAVIAARFLDSSYVDDGKGDFADTADHWAAKEIRLAAKAGWINGSGNKFRPDDFITRAEVMTIVNRMLDRTPDKEHMLPEMKKWTDNPEDAWYYEAVQEATNEHDYTRDETAIETWTLVKEHRDWAALELGWAAGNGAATPAAEPETQGLSDGI